MTRRITPSYQPGQVEKQSPCQVGCAACGDVRSWIAVVAQRKKYGANRIEAFTRAWRLITDINPFPATLGRICPHPCEKHCSRSEQDQPLAINAMERFLGDFGVDAGLSLPRGWDEQHPEWLGVIGAGPSGLSFAYQMARRGYRVRVYDAREKAGGMLRYGVPDYRLPPAVLDAEIEKILDLGVELEMNTKVGRDIRLDVLRSRHACLYLGIGAQKGSGLPIPGGDGPSIWPGTDYLAKVNVGDAPELGQQVIVVGGGNTAMDAARCARRSGAHVTVLYRRSLQEMPAIESEVEEALEEGVEFVMLSEPVWLERQADGQLTGIYARRTELGEPDSSGRRQPRAVMGSEFRLAADSLIAAISQVPLLDGLESLDHEGDWLVTDEEGSLGENIFAGGDAVNPGIAGQAILQGRQAAERLHAKLRDLPPDLETDPHIPDVHSEQIMFATRPHSEAVHPVRLDGRERVKMGMAEVATTISEEQFLAEVERCYSCGSCFGCEQCYMYCTVGSFTPVEDPRPGHYFDLNLDACGECGKCVEVCPCGYLEVNEKPTPR